MLLFTDPTAIGTWLLFCSIQFAIRCQFETPLILKINIEKARAKVVGALSFSFAIEGAWGARIQTSIYQAYCRVRNTAGHGVKLFLIVMAPDLNWLSGCFVFEDWIIYFSAHN